MTTQARKPRSLGAPRPGWKPDLTTGYQPAAPAVFDTRTRYQKPRAVPTPAPAKPAVRPFPAHRRPENLAELPAGFGATLRAARQASGLRVREIVERTGTSAQTLNVWENAKGTIRVERDRLALVCEVLGLGVPG